LYLAKLESLLGNKSGAKDMALRAVSASRTTDVRIEAAVVVACAGWSKESDQLLTGPTVDPIDDLSPETQTLISGCKAFNRGDAESAARQLSASLDLDDDLYVEFFLGRAEIENRQPQAAAEVFKDLIASKGSIIASQAYPPVLWALAHYELAGAYEKMGNSENAIDYYSRFLDIWSAAEDDLVQVSRAKAHLLSLRRANIRASPGKCLTCPRQMKGK
jgi:tetratricopeptide (TPR) repeat protein